MKKIWTIAAAVSIFLGGFALAFADDYRPGSGTVELDVSLGRLNTEAKTDMGGFVRRLSVSYGVPEKSVHLLITKEGMQPADVYMAIRLSRMSGRPLDHVVREHRANRGRGWGVIAKRLGIKPGSKEFHELKKGELSLHDEAPHGKGPKHDKGGREGHGRGRGHNK